MSVCVCMYYDINTMYFVIKYMLSSRWDDEEIKKNTILVTLNSFGTTAVVVVAAGDSDCERQKL